MNSRITLFALLALLLMGVSCVEQPPKGLAYPTGLDPDHFKKRVDGKKVRLYTIRSRQNMELSVTNLGARIVALRPDDVTGDVVCGFDSIGPYLRYKQNFGAVVGRYVGRITGAQLSIDGRDYALDRDGNGNCSHGGRPGFANRVWDMVALTDSSITLAYTSPDGESGFPGRLTLSVTYTVACDRQLRIDYRATTDRPTVLNLTNHSFFNIDGHNREGIAGQKLTVVADSICEYDAHKNATGRMLPVEGTPFDFRTPHRIGERIDTTDAQLAVTGGYDHCYRLSHPAAPGTAPALAATIEGNSLRMDVYTTEPGLHIYMANGLRGNMRGKQGAHYPARCSICFETMHFPDSPHHPQWPSTELRPGQEYRSTTIFKFTPILPIHPSSSLLHYIQTPLNLHR